MKLLTKAIEKKLPALYTNENKRPNEVKIPVKFFSPDSNWTWWATEYDPIERRFFGLVEGFEREYGYFMLDELETARGPFGLKIERDLHWNGNTTIADVQNCKPLY